MECEVNRRANRLNELKQLVSGAGLSIIDALKYEGHDMNSNPARHARFCAIKDAVKAAGDATSAQWVAIVSALRVKLQPGSA